MSDLSDALHVDKIVMGKTELKYTRDSGAVLIDFPTKLRKGHTYAIGFFYSGNPVEQGRFGGMTFGQGPGWPAVGDDGVRGGGRERLVAE